MPSFPIEFIKPEGHSFLADAFNFGANSAVVAVGGFCLATITYMALKALGFSKMATTIATAIPVTIGAIGVVGTVATVTFFSLGIVALLRRW